MDTQPQKHFSMRRNLKLGTFHLGSTMADVLGSGVWNRVMIRDLGYAATPVGLLLALRYFLVPLAIWAGERSDQPSWRGYRRLPWIWAGRLMMIIGYILIALATVELVDGGAVWWLGIVIGFIAVSVGYSISGSTFLALVYDRAPAEQRGRAVGVVWTFLIAGYAVAGILFSRLLPEYQADTFLQFFVIIGFVMFGIWLFALWGEEKSQAASEIPTQKPAPSNFREDLRGIWQNRSARLLAVFILLTFMAGFMQDALLEPFGGDVFNLSVGETTRFQAYWGTMAILSSVGALWTYRRSKRYRQLSQWGVILLIITFLMLIAAALTASEPILRPALLLLGVGYGLWNIGTLGLMVENSREEKAGFDLGLWTMITTLGRGGAVLSGTVLFDLFVWFSDDNALAYSLVFMIEAVLLMGSLVVLKMMDTTPVPPAIRAVDGELILSASMD